MVGKSSCFWILTFGWSLLKCFANWESNCKEMIPLIFMPLFVTVQVCQLIPRMYVAVLISQTREDPTLNNIQDHGANSSSVLIGCETLVGVRILWGDFGKLMKCKYGVNGTSVMSESWVSVKARSCYISLHFYCILTDVSLGSAMSGSVVFMCWLQSTIAQMLIYYSHQVIISNGFHHKSCKAYLNGMLLRCFIILLHAHVRLKMYFSICSAPCHLGCWGAHYFGFKDCNFS